MYHRGLHRYQGGRERLRVVVAAISALVLTILTLSALTHSARASTPPAAATLHYTANGNFDASGRYTPAALGFNLADVSSKGSADALPAGVRALVYLGLCGGATAAFVQTLTPYIGDSHVFGFYLVDEPDPTGQYKTRCPPANLKAESDWIHQHLPGVETTIVLMNMSASDSPTFQNTYNPVNSDVDLYGIDPYPCRTELNGCNDAMINAYVGAAEASGVPQAAIVPVFEAFGGGGYPDDGGGFYLLPTASQEAAILNTWDQLVPRPVFDYTYSWGVQQGDSALSTAPASLQQTFAQHNAGAGPPPTTTTTTTVPSTTTTRVLPRHRHHR